MVARSSGVVERARLSISAPSVVGPSCVIFRMDTHFAAKGARSPVNSSESMTRIEKIIVMDLLEFTGDLAPFAAKCVSMRKITQDGPTTLGAEIESRARSTTPDDLATIVY